MSTPPTDPPSPRLRRASPLDIDVRDIHGLDECRMVVAVQEAVWGTDSETVPASVLSVSMKRGGILLGAFVQDAVGGRSNVAGGLQPAGKLIGFVWSLQGVRDGLLTQWSHMLAVLPEFRGGHVAERLKLAQRTRAIAAGVTLIEWTFDPLQAANAHFNLHVLGAVAAGYGIDVYGTLTGPLHRGTPTDRLMTEWWIAEPHVARRVAGRQGPRPDVRLSARSAEVLEAPEVLQAVAAGDWMRPIRTDADPDWTARRVLVAVPARFSELQQRDRELAMAWRLAMRDVMTQAFGHGYRAVDFYLNRDQGGGAYLLARA